MSKEIVEKLSKVRVDSSTILNTLRGMEETQRSRGLSLATTSLEKGRMYLGEIQGNLGEEFPYETTKTATTAKEIQKAVEVSGKVLPIDSNEILNLNRLREAITIKIEEILECVMWFATEHKVGNLEDKFVRDSNIAEAYRSYKETRMWLGVRLGEIKSTQG